MGFERLAGRGQVAEALKVRGRACEFDSKCKGKDQRVVLSRARSESVLHCKSLLWNL